MAERVSPPCAALCSQARRRSRPGNGSRSTAASSASHRQQLDEIRQQNSTGQRAASSTRPPWPISARRALYAGVGQQRTDDPVSGLNSRRSVMKQTICFLPCGGAVASSRCLEDNGTLPQRAINAVRVAWNQSSLRLFPVSPHQLAGRVSLIAPILRAGRLLTPRTASRPANGRSSADRSSASASLHSSGCLSCWSL